MLTLYPYETMGRADFGWLNTHYHFSFADYHNPARMHFGALRVINDDHVRAGSGFDPHSHQDMEIITYVRTGTVIHRDNLGNEGRTNSGEVQVMSAGTGITHAEYADPKNDTHLFQIWIYPKTRGVTPRWEQAQFPHAPNTQSLPLLVSGDPADQANGTLFIHQDARLYGGKVAANATLVHKPGARHVYIVALDDNLQVGGVDMRRGDGLEATDEIELTIKTGDQDTELLVIEVPER